MEATDYNTTSTYAIRTVKLYEIDGEVMDFNTMVARYCAWDATPERRARINAAVQAFDLAEAFGSAVANRDELP